MDRGRNYVPRKEKREQQMKKYIFILVTALFFILLMTACDDGGAGGGGTDILKEYEMDYVDIINSYWDGTIFYMGKTNNVVIRIPDDSRYQFYVNGILDDTGTYNRDFNTASLTSSDPRYSGKVVGTATILDPDTVYISLNSNSIYPGVSGKLTRRK